MIASIKLVGLKVKPGAEERAGNNIYKHSVDARDCRLPSGISKHVKVRISVPMANPTLTDCMWLAENSPDCETASTVSRFLLFRDQCTKYDRFYREPCLHSCLPAVCPSVLILYSFRPVLVPTLAWSRYAVLYPRCHQDPSSDIATFDET